MSEKLAAEPDLSEKLAIFLSLPSIDSFSHASLNPYWIVASYVACLLHPTQMRILSFDNPRLASISDPARSIPYMYK